MEDLFNKPILDQMYYLRKEDFEKNVYKQNKEIQEIEQKIGELSKKFTAFLKKSIPNQKEFEEALNIFNVYELEYSSEIEFWGRTYFKLGMTDRAKIRNEFFENNAKINENDTFLNCEYNELPEWIEEQKRKYILGTKEYKKLQKEYAEIREKYPNVIEVFECLNPIELNKEEMKALVNLREVDIDMGIIERNLCFKLGMKEVINF